MFILFLFLWGWGWRGNKQYKINDIETNGIISLIEELHNVTIT